jgi:hypothetical protein
MEHSMPSNKVRRRPQRDMNLPPTLQKLLAGEDIEHTIENWRLLRDVQYFRLYADVLSEADMRRVSQTHSAWMRQTQASK